MIYLASHLWGWLLAAFLIGAVVGWLTCGDEPTRWWTGWVPLGALAFLIGLFVAVMQWLPGRAGLFLDTALLLFGVYIVGCCVGCLLKQRLMTGFAGYGTAALATAGVGGTVAGSQRSAAAGANGAPGSASARLSADGGVSKSSTTVAASTAASPNAGPANTSPSAEAVGVSALAAPPDSTGGDLPPEPAIENVPADLPGKRPRGYVTPLGGAADDLKRIRGIGRQNEGRLHALGIWHFRQIAAWVREEIDWVSGYLAFPGRIDRENWVEQAKVLAAGGDTEFSKRVDRGEVETSRDDGQKGQKNIADMPAKGKPLA